MVSAFETRKRPRPPPPSHSSPSSSTQNPSLKQQTTPPSTTPTTALKTLPCLSTTPEPLPPHSSGHAHFACPISRPVMSERPHDGEGERQDVVLRGGEEGRRIPRVRLRDSWPMGKLNSFERNFLSFVTVETKEPINCSKCPPEFDRSRLRPIRCKSTSTTGLNTTSTTGLNTTSTAGLDTASTAGLDTASTAGLDTASTAGLDTASTAGLDTASTAGLDTASTAGLDTASTAGLDTASTAGLDTASTAGLDTASTAGPESTLGTNASSAIGTTASFTRGISSRCTAETGSKLTLGASASANANASANSDSELLLSLQRRGPVLVGGANKSVFEPPGVPVYPKQLVLGTAAAVTQSGGRGQGKGRAFQPQLGLRPSDSTFFSLLLLLRSGSSNSMIAIDNKIEQAMDLVKAHLMLAVREEVEVLREQIKELAERNAQLERENYILRALRENQ
ncbi:hypothetical protein PDJAM_G00259750 [Pangasius djambal]|nr:hypothetical protein [Pangasius djambal]